MSSRRSGRRPRIASSSSSRRPRRGRAKLARRSVLRMPDELPPALDSATTEELAAEFDQRDSEHGRVVLFTAAFLRTVKAGRPCAEVALAYDRRHGRLPKDWQAALLAGTKR